MALAINGKKVVGYALGGNEFYSIDEHADGTITYNGHTYIWKPKASSDSLTCTFHSYTTSNPYSVSTALNQKLSDNSALTLKDLIDKGEKIRLTVTFRNNSNGPSYSLSSGLIDLSKPDSKGHFNFQWIDYNNSSNTYCYPDSGANMFSVYSDAIGAYSSTDYDNGHMVILSDES